MLVHSSEQLLPCSSREHPLWDICLCVCTNILIGGAQSLSPNAGPQLTKEDTICTKSGWDSADATQADKCLLS